jgi:hypothetical protein
MGKRIVWWGFPGGQLFFYTIFLGINICRGYCLRRGAEFMGRGGKWNENNYVKV